MRIVGLEEHVVLPEMLDAWSRISGLPQIAELGFGEEPMAQRLRDIGSRRLAEMDDRGVDVQVLSATTPALQNPSPDTAAAVARDVNDALSAAISRNPDRFQSLPPCLRQIRSRRRRAWNGLSRILAHAAR